MPKLPKISNTIFFSIIVLIVGVGIVAFLLISNDSPFKKSKEQPHTKSESRKLASINGKVTEIDFKNMTLVIETAFEEVTYKVRLESGGRVLINDKESSFSEIKTEDSVTLYSSDNEIKSNKIASINLISVNRITRELLDKLNGK